MLIAKLALGLGGAILLAGACTFHEGVLRVSVDEHRANGSHIHLLLPAAVMPIAVRLAPQREIKHALLEAGPWLPALHTLARELRNYPDADFVEVQDAQQHVQVRTRAGTLQIDIELPEKAVHVSCPLAAIDDLSAELEPRRPMA